MKKSLFVASLVAAALLMPGTKAQAQFGIGFNSPIDMNFSVFDGVDVDGNTHSYNDVDGITRIGFIGSVASNHTSSGINPDTGGQANNGDTVRTAGGAVATTYLNAGGSPIPVPSSQRIDAGAVGPGNPFGIVTSFLELTATFDLTGVMFNVTSDQQFAVALQSGEIKFYVDNILNPSDVTNNTGDFDSATNSGAIGDASTWDNGTHVATWTYINGTGVISFEGSLADGSTELGTQLTADPVLGFLAGEIADLVGNLLMYTTTDDEPLTPIPGQLPANMDSVFPGFSTGWGTGGVDVRAALDGSSTFNVVPEPSSFVLLSLGGVALVGVAARRRRNAKKAA